MEIQINYFPDTKKYKYGGLRQGAKFSFRHFKGACVCTQSYLFVAPWIVAHQAPLSMKISREEYWNRLPFPSPGKSSQSRDQIHVSCLAGRFFTTVLPEYPTIYMQI